MRCTSSLLLSRCRSARESAAKTGLPRTLNPETYFQERAARAIPGEAKRILKKAGRGNPPMPGDEIK